MPAHPPLAPARLCYSEAGTPFSEAFGDVYHSADGGLGQARHVFLAGNGLPERWQGQRQFTILETGFGLGLNFLATWAAWRADPQRPERLDFISAELHPFTATDLARLHKQWPDFAPLSQELLTQWPPLVPGFQRLYLDGGRVCLTLLLGDAAHMLRQLQARVDAVYLDGFAPGKNPELWSERVFTTLARLARPGATLATYTVAAAVREGLERAGLQVEKRPGFGRKREMLTARFTPHHAIAEPAPETAREAVIIGAGLAGSMLAERLAARGWQVQLVERHAGPAQEASGNLAGIVRPMLAKDDNIASRLSRACFLYATRHWLAMADAGLTLRWFPQGVLQLARDAQHAALQREIVEARAFPTDYARFLDATEATQLLNWPVEHGGWLFPQGSHANPASLCQASLDNHPERIRRLYSHTALRLERRDDLWEVLDGNGQPIASAPVAILAAGTDALGFAQAQGLPIRRVRGQVSHIPEGCIPALPMALTREGYATPALDGLHCAGASYEFDDGTDLRPEAHAGNLARLEHMLPGASAGIAPASLSGRVGFRAVTPDRLPLVGALPDPSQPIALREAQLADVPRWPVLYGLLGYGSRGLVWAALAAELLASQLDGNPLPLESDLIEAIDPARFWLRQHRRGRHSSRAQQ